MVDEHVSVPARALRRWGRGVGVGLVLGLVVSSLGWSWGGSAGAVGGPSVVLVAAPASAGLSKIKHVIVIMQENRSFDHYFGMYPGADGIPVDGGGNPTVCVNDPKTGQCVYPWHDPADISNAGPHGARSANSDINNGAMDGFIQEYEKALQNCESKPNAPDCGVPKPVPDVMSYKLRSDLPEYWAYADNYVLQDHMFGTGRTWSLPEHLFMVSNWSARCYRPGDPMSCENEVDAVDDARFQPAPNYAWTDVTHLLSQNSVPWGYYVFDGTEPDCTDPGDLTCIPLPQSFRTGSIWNPLPYFTDVQDAGQLGNIQSVDNFAAAARNGTLPAVSWVVPTNSVSEHAPAPISDGRKYVTYMINQVMQGPNWDSSAIFLAWDDWGGFYDHMNPPTASANGFGIRVPSLVISPYAKQGYVDHNVYSFDSYQRFIEDVFLGSSRLDPTTDGRPDPRPVVGENYPGLGNLADAFDFTQAPRPPLILGNTDASKVAAPITPKAKALAAPPTTAAAPVKDSIFPTAAKAAATPATGGPLTGTAPFTAVFDGSQTTAGSSPMKSWRLRFGDGTVTSGRGAPPSAISHTYPTAGVYKAKLHVKDKAQGFGDDTVIVNVTAAPPKVWLAGNKPLGFDSLTEKFDASESSPGNWTISWGDGTPDATGTGTPPAGITHDYAGLGIFTATLTVTDPGTGLSNVARAISTVSASRAPTALTKNPDVGDTSAHLLTDIWTNGRPTTYHFEWGTAPDQLTHITNTRTAANGASSPAQPISGLTTDTTYYYRVVATNSVGTTNGDVIAFTPSSGPRVTLGAASGILADQATLNGQVNPRGSAATAHFEWGLGDTIDQLTPDVDLGSGRANVLITFTLTGLAPDTTYSFRLVATNGVGSTTSTIKTFTTAPA
jgi:phospholipase C